MQHIPIEPGIVELVRPKLRRVAAIRCHRAVPSGCEGNDNAASPGARPVDPGPVTRELARCELTRRVRAALADDAGLSPEALRPGGDVRGLATRAGMGDRNAVVADHERSVELDDNVEEQGADCGQPHRKIVAWTTVVGPEGSARSPSAASSAPRVRSRPDAALRRRVATAAPHAAWRRSRMHRAFSSWSARKLRAGAPTPIRARRVASKRRLLSVPSV